MQKYVLASLALLMSLSLWTSVQGREPMTPTDIVERASPAVVQIVAYEDVPLRTLYIEEVDGELYLREVEEIISNVAASSGSGFFATSDGYILTNKHVVAADRQYLVSMGDQELEARVVYRDPAYDLAVLKVEGDDFPTLPWSPEALEVGDRVVAMGNALGVYTDSATAGAITSLDEDVAVDQGWKYIDGEWMWSYIELLDLIQTDAKVYPGDSGGPVLNDHGEVVGVNVATALGEQVGYAIPAALAKEALERAQR